MKWCDKEKQKRESDDLSEKQSTIKNGQYKKRNELLYFPCLICAARNAAQS